MSFISELQRRNVFRVAVGYLAAAWLLIQILETLFPIFGLPETSIRIVVVLLGVGFLPMMLLAWLFDWTPDGIRRDEGKAVTETDVASRRRMDRIIFLVLGVAVVYFAVDKFVFEPGRRAELARDARQEGRIEAVLDRYEGKSIIVLPFASFSTEADQEYFADGLTEELLNLLAQVAELRVISRSTAFSFKGKDVVVPEVAKRLNVSHVLEGSVRKAGNRVRITAQLIEASTDTHLWSATYDRVLEDIFAIQDEISAAVVGQLHIELLGDMPTAAEIDPQAYELYLRAHLIVEGNLEGTLDEAEAILEEALSVEPDYLPALTELARAYEWNPREGEPIGEQRARVQAIVDHMADIAPESSYTNVWQGYIAIKWHSDFAAGARHYEQAVADDPLNPEPVMRVVASLLTDLGKWEEAAAVVRYNLSRDPACVNCVYMLGKALFKGGRYREAAEELERVMQWQGPTGPLLWNIGSAWLAAGAPDRALDYFDRDIDRNGGGSDYNRAMALYDLGRMGEFQEEFEAFRAENPNNHEALAAIYAWTGQNDLAFAELEKVVAESGTTAARFATVDDFSRIRSDPRFAEFLETYDVAGDEELSKIAFDPPFPPAMQARIDRYRQVTIDTTEESH